MPGGGDIRAGRAYVELLLKGGAAFNKSLRAASQQLKDFGGGVAKIGAVMSGLGTAITAPLALAVKQFADVGSALKDMSSRTGASAQALAELGYAAEQTGAEASDVGIGFKSMAKKITEAANGSKTARKDIEDLGLSVEALAKMTPDQQFEALGKAIAGIPDPTKRAAAAMEIFGKSGQKLVPMLADMEALRKKARDLGIVPDDAQIELADKLGDALDDVKKAAGGVVFQIGSALAGAVLKGAKAVTTIVVGIGKWVKENQGVVVTVAAVGAGIVAAGAAITALGVTIVGVGAVLGGLSTILGGIGAALTFLLSPLGLVAAALTAVAWAKWAGSAKQAAATVATVLAPLGQTVKDTLQGISDALSSGNLALAGKVAMAGLKAALLQGVEGLSTAVGGALGDFIGTIGTQLIKGDLEGVWATICAGLSNEWGKTWEGIVAIATTAINKILDGWQKASSSIAKSMLFMDRKGSVLTAGVNLEAEQEKENRMNPAAIKAAQANLDQHRKDLAEAEAGGGTMTNKQGIEQSAEGLRVVIADLEKRLAELAKGPVDVLDQAFKSAEEQIANNFTAPRANVDQKLRDAQNDSDERARAFRERTKGGAGVAVGAAADALADLDKLLIEAAAGKKDAEAKKKPPATAGDETTGPEAVAGRGPSAAGTFSAAAAGLMGGGGPMEETAKNTAKIAANTDPKNQPRQQTGGYLPPGMKPEAPKPNIGSLKDLADKNKPPLEPVDFGPLRELQEKNSPENLAAAAAERAAEREQSAATDKQNLDRAQAALEELKAKVEASKAAGAERIRNATRNFELGGPQRDIRNLGAAGGGVSMDDTNKRLDKLIEETKATRRAIQDTAEVYV